MNYKEVLAFYKRRVPRKARDAKTQAKRILAQKLCGCIKKVTSRNSKLLRLRLHNLTPDYGFASVFRHKIQEPRAIRICTRSIFNKKGLRRGRFTCKKTPSVGVRFLR